jgi:urea transport system substrate-binding protein
MTNTTACPSPETIDDLLANRLPAAEAEAVRLHLTTCPICVEGRSKSPAPAAPAAKPPAYPFLSPPQGPGELGRLDGHKVFGLLGEGGMALVFDAEDTTLGRRVALKVLRPHMADPTTRERFLREARLIAGLPHDHIVTVFRVGEAGGVPYLTMERLEGMSLEDRLKRDRWLPLAEALALTREAAEGLIVAHDAGLVHRDIKPANLWLEARQGRFRRVKLIDFGIARRVNQDSNLTTTGQVLGTPMYMAPEQAMGKPVDGRADLYSLGCVLFHTLTGKPPFDGRGTETMALLHAIIVGNAPKVADAAPQLPVAVAELIQQLLSRDPDGRPENARALVERLRHLEEAACGEVVPPPPPPSARAARGLMRRPGLLGIWLGALAIGAALTVSVVAMWMKLAGHGGKPLRLGLLHSATGGMSLHERPVAQATRFAVEEINAAGGVGGRPVEIVEEDGRSDDDTFAEKARLLIDEKGADVLFGCWTSSSRKRVAEVCADRDRLLFYSAASEGLEVSPIVVYLGGVPNQNVLPLVEWAAHRKGKKRFYLIGTDAVYSHAVHEILKHKIAELKAEVAGERFVRPGEADFTKVVAELTAANADMVINTIDGQGNISLFNALRGAGVTPKQVATAWVTMSEVELSAFHADKAVGDFSVAGYFDRLSGKANRSFLKRYRDRYGAGERVNDAMQTAYFGVHLWKNAVEKAGPKGGTPDFAALRKALRGLTVDAPEGPVEIDEKTQHAYRTALIGEIVAGESGLDFNVVDTSRDPVRPEPFPHWRTEKEWKGFLDGLYTKWGGRWANPR